jgi:serine/threonine protein phosphatase PrpC
LAFVWDLSGDEIDPDTGKAADEAPHKYLQNLGTGGNGMALIRTESGNDYGIGGGFVVNRRTGEAFEVGQIPKFTVGEPLVIPGIPETSPVKGLLVEYRNEARSSLAEQIPGKNPFDGLGQRIQEAKNQQWHLPAGGRAERPTLPLPVVPPEQQRGRLKQVSGRMRAWREGGAEAARNRERLVSVEVGHYNVPKHFWEYNRNKGDDRVFVDEEAGHYVVLDGVSGEGDGRGGAAAQVAVNFFAHGGLGEGNRGTDNDPANAALALKHGLERADIAIADVADATSAACTAIRVLPNGHVAWAQRGDTAAYILRADGKLKRLGKEESVWEQLSKEEQKKYEKEGPSYAVERAKNTLTNWLGSGRPTDENGQPITQSGFEEVEPGDTICVFSDGISKVWSDDEIKAKMRGKDPQAAARQLANGEGSDDQSIIMIKVGAAASQSKRSRSSSKLAA